MSSLPMVSSAMTDDDDDIIFVVDSGGGGGGSGSCDGECASCGCDRWAESDL